MVPQLDLCLDVVTLLSECIPNKDLKCSYALHQYCEQLYLFISKVGRVGPGQVCKLAETVRVQS